MIIIQEIKRKKKYLMPEMPDFQSFKLKYAWLKRQEKLAAIINIKSISIQVRDIKQMVHTSNMRLIALNSKLYLNNKIYSLNNDDYITITKSSDLNKILIYELITADWLLNYNEIQSKTNLEIEEELIRIKDKITILEDEIKRKKLNNFSVSGLSRRLKLYQYKLSCLEDYINTKLNEENDLVDNVLKRVLIKKDI